MQSLLTREMILAAVKEEYGSMFVNVQEEFQAWENAEVQRRVEQTPCPECVERDYWGDD